MANLGSVLLLRPYKRWRRQRPPGLVWLCSAQRTAIGNIIVMGRGARCVGHGDGVALTCWWRAIMAGIFLTSSVQILRQALAEYREGRRAMGIVVRVANSFTASKAPPFQALKRVVSHPPWSEKRTSALSPWGWGVHTGTVLSLHTGHQGHRWGFPISFFPIVHAFFFLRARPMPSTLDHLVHHVRQSWSRHFVQLRSSCPRTSRASSSRVVLSSAIRGGLKGFSDVSTSACSSS